MMDIEFRPQWTFTPTGCLFVTVGILFSFYFILKSLILGILTCILYFMVVPSAVAMVSTESSLMLTEVTFYIIWIPVSVLIGWTKHLQNGEAVQWICESPVVPYVRTLTVTVALMYDVYITWSFLSILPVSGLMCLFTFALHLLLNKIFSQPWEHASTACSLFLKLSLFLVTFVLLINVHWSLVKSFKLNLLSAFIVTMFCCESVIGSSKDFKDFLNAVDLGNMVALQEEAVLKVMTFIDMSVCFVICVMSYQQTSQINYFIGLINLIPPLVKLYNIQMAFDEEWVTVFRRSRSLTTREVSSFDDVCPICLTKMSSAKLTLCGHLFHNKCLQKCLRQKLSCPVCRECMCIRKTCPSFRALSETAT